MDFRDTLKQASHLYTDRDGAATLNTIFHMKRNENIILFKCFSFSSACDFNEVRVLSKCRETYRNMPVKL